MISVLISIMNVWIINVMPTNDFSKTVQNVGLPLPHLLQAFEENLTPTPEKKKTSIFDLYFLSEATTCDGWGGIVRKKWSGYFLNYY